jgi:nitroreductase
VHVVAGDVRKRLEAEVLAHRETNPPDVRAEFPRENKRKEPYLGRMRKLGKEMYSLIGIPKGDEAANWAQWGRNYKFFDAPVGLIFTVDKELDRMSYVDIGMFMQSFMLAAKTKGLDTCPQGAWNNYWTVTRRVLNVPDDEYIICGISLGYADGSAVVNTLVSEREPVMSFATFHGF